MQFLLASVRIMEPRRRNPPRGLSFPEIIMAALTDATLLRYHDATTLFYSPLGPLVRYGNGTLQIQDLNPEVRTQWRMSRAEMIRFGWKCIVASFSAPRG